MGDSRVSIRNQSRQATLVARGEWARTVGARLRGLMGQPALHPDEGLILVGEKSIHTFFMKSPIDVVYADETWKVVRVDPAMARNRIGPFVWRAKYILELPVGVIDATGTAVGDQLAPQAQA